MRKHWHLLALALALMTSRGEAASTVISGERIPLSQPPRWTTSGIWDSSGEQLLLVDVLEGKVLQYNLQGKRTEAVSNPAFRNPILIHRAGPDEVWVEDEDGRLVELNGKLEQPRELIQLTEKVKSSKGSLRSVLGWVPLSLSEVMVFGDIQRTKGATGAVLRVPLKEPASFQILREIGLETPEHRFFMVGQPYLAAVQSKPYFLISADTPQVVGPKGAGFRIVRRNAESGATEPFGRPDLPKRVTMSTTALLFEGLERSSTSAGLYGWNGSLFVLMRTPAGKGATSWSLMKIDPSTGKRLWNRAIDTRANHLIVVPGDKYWAFVEKGPVKGPGNQEVRSYLRVPASVIAEP